MSLRRVYNRVAKKHKITSTEVSVLVNHFYKMVEEDLKNNSHISIYKIGRFKNGNTDSKTTKED